jgi:hypothetical protein
MTQGKGMDMEIFSLKQYVKLKTPSQSSDKVTSNTKVSRNLNKHGDDEDRKEEGENRHIGGKRDTVEGKSVTLMDLISGFSQVCHTLQYFCPKYSIKLYFA